MAILLCEIVLGPVVLSFPRRLIIKNYILK